MPGLSRLSIKQGRGSNHFDRVRAFEEEYRQQDQCNREQQNIHHRENDRELRQTDKYHGDAKHH